MLRVKLKQKGSAAIEIADGVAIRVIDANGAETKTVADGNSVIAIGADGNPLDGFKWPQKDVELAVVS